MLETANFTTDNYSAIPATKDEIRKLFTSFNIKNEDLILTVIAKCYSRQVGSNWIESRYITWKNHTYFNATSGNLHVAGTLVPTLDLFIDEKQYIERFFREWLGLVVSVSRLRIVIPTFGENIGTFANIVSILRSLITIFKVGNFVKYFEYTNYEEFCENLLLNLSEAKLYDTRRTTFILLYFLLLMKNFTTRDMLITERQVDASLKYRFSPTERASSYFSDCTKQEKEILKLVLRESKDYLHNVMDKRFTDKAMLTNAKRAATSALEVFETSIIR